jgi:hypothetical protein
MADDRSWPKSARRGESSSDTVCRIEPRPGHVSYIPVPDSDTVSGVLVALVALLSFADFVSAACGLNRTETVQDAPAGRFAGQLFVCENHDA